MHAGAVCGYAAGIVRIAFCCGGSLFDMPLGIFVAALNICAAHCHSGESRVVFLDGALDMGGHLTAVVSYACYISYAHWIFAKHISELVGGSR